MPALYCCFSLELNRRSLDQAGQIYLFKFGHTTEPQAPLGRFNDGWDVDGVRSAPLALCRDWIDVGYWPSDNARGLVDKRLLSFLSESGAFRLEAAIRSEVRRADEKANLNGLTEIRCIRYEDIPMLDGLMRDRGLNDPLAEQALLYVFGYVTGLVHAQVLGIPRDGLGSPHLSAA